MPNEKNNELVARFEKAGQAHVFRFWEDLNEPERESFLEQLRSVDLPLMQSLIEEHICKKTPVTAAEFAPAVPLPLPRNDQERALEQDARHAGEAALRAGKIAVFVVAGGDATRLGFDAPKGTFPIGPVSKRSLFNVFADQIRALEARYETTLPWYVMTSRNNHEATVRHFRENNFFGLGEDNVMFFPQDMIPAVDAKGKFMLEAKNRLFMNPNGHGGSILALGKSGAIADMKRRGVEQIFYFQVDNVLCKLADPVFMGHHILAGTGMSSKVVEKTYPEEKVGVVGFNNGRLGTIEYSELPEALMNERDSDGRLKYRAGNIAIHAICVDFVEKLNKSKFHLPYKCANKRVPFLDEDGGLVNPEKPNAHKFETFVFDALAETENSVVMECRREEEFAPVKNAEGVDSVGSAREMMAAMFAGWLEAAGVEVSRDGDGKIKYVVEISPLFALDAAELAEKIEPDFQITKDMFLK